MTVKLQKCCAAGSSVGNGRLGPTTGVYNDDRHGRHLKYESFAFRFLMRYIAAQSVR